MQLRKDAIRTNLIELIVQMTIHGPAKILNSKLTSIKLIWTVCLISSAGYCGYAVVSSVLNYLMFEYTTSFDYCTEIPAEFPTITICNLNMFQTEHSINYVSDFLKRNSKQNFSDGAKRFFLLNELMSNFSNSALRSFSYSLNETLLECTFMSLKCNETDFEWVFDSIYGNCYRFNSGKNSEGKQILIKNLSSIGDTYGLHLELFLGDPDLMPEFLKTYGLHIMINNKTVKPVPHEGLNAAAGKETNIFIDRLFSDRLTTPYNDCLDNLNTLDAYDSDLFRTIIKQNLTYRQFDCFYLCYQKQTIEKCNCQVNNFAKISNVSDCATFPQISCSNIEWDLFLNSDINAKCSSLCPLECNLNFLSFTTTQSDYPTSAYAKQLITRHNHIKSKFNTSIDYPTLKNSVLSLNVYYEKLGYTIIGQQPKYQIFDLVSNIGGLLGLFLGMSLLSIVEIIEFLIELILYLTSSNNQIDV